MWATKKRNVFFRFIVFVDQADHSSTLKHDDGVVVVMGTGWGGSGGTAQKERGRWNMVTR